MQISVDRLVSRSMHPPRQWYSAAAATRAVLVAFGTTSSNTRYWVLGSDLYCIFAYLRHKSGPHISQLYSADNGLQKVVGVLLESHTIRLRLLRLGDVVVSGNCGRNSVSTGEVI